MEKFIDRNSLKSSDKKEGDLAYFAGITHCGILAQATIALPYVNQSKIRKIKDVVSGAIVLATADVAQVQDDKKVSSPKKILLRLFSAYLR